MKDKQFMFHFRKAILFIVTTVHLLSLFFVDSLGDIERSITFLTGFYAYIELLKMMEK